jgi:hypothetical protein
MKNIKNGATTERKAFCSENLLISFIANKTEVK